MNVVRTAWLLFILLVVVMVFGLSAVLAQSTVVCSDGYCTIREDSMITLLRYVRYLESLVGKTCI